VKPKHKFYVGHPKMVRDLGNWGQDSLKDAVAKAQKQLDATGDPQMVVRIVYRKWQPITVEAV
jgi:hypothetical protein